MHKTVSTLPKLLAYGVALIIFLMPFHAFMTVWASSFVGHYTALRLWKEALLLLLALGSLVLCVANRTVRKSLLQDRLFQVIALYGVILVLFTAAGLVFGTANRKAAAYGLLLDGRFLGFFCVTWLVSLESDFLVRNWRKLLLIPGAVVAGFAAVQYIALPLDFLKHFGYGPKTISPTETIDQKAAYRRVQSTLRGANPLGAYLIVILSALGARLLLGRGRVVSAALFVLALFALFATSSRSAWIGALCSLALLLWLSARSARMRRSLILAASVGVLISVSIVVAFRHNDRFQNLVFHTSSTSHSAVSSNAGHASALKSGIMDVARQPWGRGVGTAGPASVYSKAPARIAENYYVQIAQETGLEGLAAFVAVVVLLALRLWQRRGHELAMVMLVSLAGLVLVNMLLHGWADDTIAYVWWGLAGAAMSLPLKDVSPRPPGAGIPKARTRQGDAAAE